MEEVQEVEEVETVEETKYLEAAIEKAGDTLTAVASTNSVDRHGEIVDNNGWDLKAYKKNPVILWGHDHSQLPIGVSKKTWVEGTGKSAKLIIQPIIHEVTEQSRAIKELIDLGILKTLSVGFKPIESPDGVTFTKNELLEVSVVNVPANADAMMMAYKGLKQAGIDDEVIEEVGVKVDWTDRLATMEKDINDLRDLVKAASVNPKRPTEERLSQLKVIAKASDRVLEAENKQVVVDRKRLVKTIKRATELLIVQEKGNL